VNPGLISGLRDYPTGLVLDGNGHRFVATELHGVVGEYTTSGGTVNASLIPGLTFSYPADLASDGSGELFVAEGQSGMIGEFTTNGGTVNAALISGLTQPSAVAVVPEPAVALWLAFACVVVPRRRSAYLQAPAAH